MTTKVMVVGNEKPRQKPIPRIRLTGYWLDEAGFTCDSLATAEYEPGRIVIKLQGSGLDTYSRVVKGVLKNKAGLLQVKPAFYNKNRTSHIEIKGLWLEDFGFKTGSVFVVQAEYGEITIFLVDPEKL